MAQLLALLYLVYGFFVLYVIVQMVLRLALIDILLALAPIALGLWVSCRIRRDGEGTGCASS